MGEPLIYEICRAGRCAVSLPECDVPKTPLPEGCVRDDLPLPEVAEVDLVRHYIRLSQMNYGIDTGFYPLGSCTMKYNPKVNEVAARIPGFATLHPLQPEASIQGAMGLMLELQEMLAEIGGFAGVTLQPAAGAHGELTGVLMMRKYLHDRGERERNIILVPDSAHGTNPATTSMSGLKVVEVPSDRRGNVDLATLRTPYPNEPYFYKTQLVGYGHDDTATCRSVQLREDDAGDRHGLHEQLCLADAVLPCGGIQDEQYLVYGAPELPLRNARHLAELLHEVGLDVDAACRVR